MSTQVVPEDAPGTDGDVEEQTGIGHAKHHTHTHDSWHNGYIHRGILAMYKPGDHMEGLHLNNKPIFMISISVIQTIAFIYYQSEECLAIKPNADSLLYMECPRFANTQLSYRVCCREEVWRWVTYSLVHRDWSHLLFNLVIQLLFGTFLESVNGRKWGSVSIGCLYLSGVLAGSLTSSIFEPDVNIVGASGAVYCLIGAWFAFIALNADDIHDLTQWVMVLFLLIITCADFGTAIQEKYVEKTNIATSVSAHLGGLLMGGTFGVVILHNDHVTWQEKLLKIFGIILSCVGVIVGIFYNSFTEPSIAAYCETDANCALY